MTIVARFLSHQMMTMMTMTMMTTTMTNLQFHRMKSYPSETWKPSSNFYNKYKTMNFLSEFLIRRNQVKKPSVCLAEAVAVVVGVVDCLEAEGDLAEAAREELAPKAKKKSEKLDKNGKKPLRKPSVLSEKNALNEPPLASEAKGLSEPNDLREACEEKEVNEVSVLNEVKEANAVSARKR